MPTPPPANPTAARFYVDILAMLMIKTEGQRTDQETRELEMLLHELRMRVMDIQPAPQGIPTPQNPR